MDELDEESDLEGPRPETGGPRPHQMRGDGCNVKRIEDLGADSSKKEQTRATAAGHPSSDGARRRVAHGGVF